MDSPKIIGPLVFSELSKKQRSAVLKLTIRDTEFSWSGFRAAIAEGKNPTMFLCKISGEIIGWSAIYETTTLKIFPGGKREDVKIMMTHRFVREDMRGRGYGTKLKERVDRFGQARAFDPS